MKNIFKAILILTVFAGFTSCEDEQDLKFADADGSFRILTPQTGDSVILKPETPNNPGLVMNWEAVDYGTPTEVTYTIEIDKNGNEFADAVTLTNTTNTYITVNMETLNGAAIAAGLEPFTEGGLDIRVRSSIGDGSNVLVSDTITYLVTPYTTEAPKMYVVGNFLNASGYGNDWTPGDAVPIASSGFGQTDFEGYVYMNMPSIEYKILPTNISFDGDWGDDGSFTGTLIQDGESNIVMSGPGYFRVRANTALGTYSATPTAWGIIGSATPTGWDSDTDMTYNATTKKWEITIALTGGQEIKFRANDDWGLNFGDNGGDSLLEADGSNIAVPATGTYTVTLDLSSPRQYTYTLTQN